MQPSNLNFFLLLCCSTSELHQNFLILIPDTIFPLATIWILNYELWLKVDFPYKTSTRTLTITSVAVLIFLYLSSFAREHWNKWLRWLSPYFNEIPILKYSYLSLLSTSHFVSFLNSANEVPAVRILPLDGVMAKASLAISSTRRCSHSEVSKWMLFIENFTQCLVNLKRSLIILAVLNYK